MIARRRAGGASCGMWGEMRSRCQCPEPAFDPSIVSDMSGPRSFADSRSIWSASAHARTRTLTWPNRRARGSMCRWRAGVAGADEIRSLDAVAREPKTMHARDVIVPGPRGTGSWAHRRSAIWSVRQRDFMRLAAMPRGRDFSPTEIKAAGHWLICIFTTQISFTGVLASRIRWFRSDGWEQWRD